MTSTILRKMRVLAGATLLTLGALHGADLAYAESTVGGEAFSLSVDVSLPLAGNILLARTPYVGLPPEGGMHSASLPSITVPLVLHSDTLAVETEGTVGVATASSSSGSRIEDLSLLHGLITAELLIAESSSACGDGLASSSAAGSRFAKLVIAGVPIPILPPPNTVIPLAGIGTVIVNEQVASGDGTETAALTVNMLRVVLDIPHGLKGEIIVSSATSAVACDGTTAPTPTATPPVCLPGPPPVPHGPIVSGEATGARLDLPHTVLGPLPHVVLPPAGGGASATVLAVDKGTVLTTATLAAETTGAVTPTSAASESRATVESLALLDGLITADAVSALSRSACDGGAADSDAVGSTIVNLRVGPVVVGNVVPAPNSVIVVPGVATVVLNEQMASGDGIDASALTVTMIRVRVDHLLGGGELVVASAHSDVDCAPAAAPPPPPDTSVSGTGFLVSVAVPPLLLGQTPVVTLEPGGGVAESALLTLELPQTLTVEAATIESVGTAAMGMADASTAANVLAVDLLDGLVTADVIAVVSASTCDGTAAGSSDAGTEFLSLVVDGHAIGGTPAPNTTIVIPGIATVILNEQIVGGDGVATSSLTINAIRVELAHPIGAEIVVGSVHSDVDCHGPAPTPVPTGPTPTYCPPEPTLTPPAPEPTMTATDPTPQPTPPAATGTPPGPTTTPPGPTQTPPGPTTTPPGPTATMTAGPTAEPTPAPHPYQCYETHHGPRRLSVTLHDQRGPGDRVDLRKQKRLCNPASIDDEHPEALADPVHYAKYTIRQREPKLPKLSDVTILNRFGIAVMDVKRPDYALVPTAKSETGPVVADLPPANHYKCHRVGRVRQRADGMRVEDQFAVQTLDLRKPRRLCLPADLNGQGIVHPNPALMCYAVRPTKNSVRFRGTDDVVHTDNEFGPDSYPAFRPTELCVPSLVSP